MRGAQADLRAARAAILAGRAAEALQHLDRFAERLGRLPPDPETRADLQAGIHELRILADATLRGAQEGAAQVRAIVEAARMLQTYDHDGRRKVQSIVALEPRRY